jgi:hypothetical protein
MTIKIVVDKTRLAIYDGLILIYEDFNHSRFAIFLLWILVFIKSKDVNCKRSDAT